MPFALSPDNPYGRKSLPLDHMKYWPTAPEKSGPNPPDLEQTDDLLPRNQGAFLSALNWLARPGQVVKNVLTGNFEGAARQAGDFLGDAVDAALPGDWIPQFSRPQDEVQGSQLLGLDDAWRKEHPFLNMAASLPVDILSDPLTYTGFGPLIKGAGLAAKGAEQVALKLPRGAEAVKAVKDTATAAARGIRDVAGSPRVAPPIGAGAGAANAAKAGVAEAGGKQVQELYRGFTPQELEVAGDVSDNLLYDAAGRPTRKIVAAPAPTLAERIAAHPGAAGMDPARIEQIIRDTESFMARQGTEGGLGAPVSSVSDMLSEGGRPTGSKGDYPIFTPGPGVEGYVPRMYKGQTEQDAIDEILGSGGASSGKPLNERTLRTPEMVMEHFAKNPQLSTVRNLAERVANRVSQQSELAKRAVMGEKILQAVKEGKIKLSPEAIKQLADEAATFRPVRAEGYASTGIEPGMPLPGDSLTKYGVGSQSGLSPELGGNVTADMTGRTGASLDDAGKMGEFSGNASPPAAMQMMITKKMRNELTDLGYTKGQIDAMLPDDAVLAIKQQQGPLRAGGLDMLGGAGPKVGSNPYNLGDVSGMAKPPNTSSAVDMTSGMGPKVESGLVGEMSGKSLPPGTGEAVDLVPGGPRVPNDTLGLGDASGRSLPPGKQTFAHQAFDPLASLSGATKPLDDLTRTMDHVMNHEFRLADPASRKIVNAAIQSLDPESMKYANSMMNGLPPRGPAMQALAKMNKVIKPIMIYGFVIPKIGTDIRNAISGVWQAFANPNTRGTALAAAGRLPSTIADSVTRALGLKVDTGSLSKVLDVAEQAMKDSGGVYSKALQLMEAHPGAGGFTGPQIAAVYRSGAPGGFVTMEGMLQTMAGTPWKQKYKTITEFPARIFKGVEDRMRVGMGLDLLKAGKSEADIGKFVNDALYSYDVTSAGNRAARDVLPFQQFTFKAVPQTVNLLNEKPWLAVGMASLLTEKQGQPTYPYMDSKLNIPLGRNEAGDPQYISGTGLPFESLGQIPNPSGSLQQTGRELERILGGSSQPLLKSAFGLLSGEDPYFESPFGTYSKLPGNIEGGSLGRAYNVLNGVGALQPIDAPLRTIGKITDSRSSPGVRAIDILTGANVVSVNENKALQQRLTDYLRHNPDVDSYQALYSRSNDPVVKALLQQLAAAKKRIKNQRKFAS